MTLGKIGTRKMMGKPSDEELPEKDIIFIDYDGRILYSYTTAEAAQLSALPELPTHEGLTCQGWNYTFEELADTVADVGEACVGANYITADGKTRIGITIRDPKYSAIPIYFSQTVSNGVNIDWGDGSAVETVSGTVYVNTAHQYPSVFPASYTITLELTQGEMWFEGQLFGADANNATKSGFAWASMIDSVLFGNITRIGWNASMLDFSSVKYFPVPNGIRNYGASGCGNSNYMVMSYVAPRGSFASIRGYTSMRRVSLAGDITSVSEWFDGCNSLTRLMLPHNVSTLNQYALRGLPNLREMRLPSGISRIPPRCFQGNYSLMYVRFPHLVASIGETAFGNCFGLKTFDFRRLEAVPTLDNVNAFSNTPSDAEIVVPDSLYESWIAATNWSDSSIVGKIVKASESSLGAL